MDFCTSENNVSDSSDNKSTTIINTITDFIRPPLLALSEMSSVGVGYSSPPVTTVVSSSMMESTSMTSTLPRPSLFADSEEITSVTATSVGTTTGPNNTCSDTLSKEPLKAITVVSSSMMESTSMTSTLPRPCLFADSEEITSVTATSVGTTTDPNNTCSDTLSKEPPKAITVVSSSMMESTSMTSTLPRSSPFADSEEITSVTATFVGVTTDPNNTCSYTLSKEPLKAITVVSSSMMESTSMTSTLPQPYLFADSEEITSVTATSVGTTTDPNNTCSDTLSKNHQRQLQLCPVL